MNRFGDVSANSDLSEEEHPGEKNPCSGGDKKGCPQPPSKEAVVRKQFD
jgi:hypothetical protein